MIVKELHCNEIIEDYKVKDPETYHKNHSDFLRGLKEASVEVDGKIAVRPIRVKSVRAKKLKWNEDIEMWEFHSKIKVNVLD